MSQTSPRQRTNPPDGGPSGGGEGVNPRILRGESVQVSGWANSLKRQTASGGPPADLYSFLPRNPGIYSLNRKEEAMIRYPLAARILFIVVFLIYGVLAILFGFYVDHGQNITGRIFIITGILALLTSIIFILLTRSKATDRGTPKD